jgi:hypothetical protein
MCRIHEVWTLFHGATLEDRPRYNIADCFETFPFPAGCETSSTLEELGREYYEFRAALMVRHNEGLTKIYNRFHDPEEHSPDILKLRELHATMDAAVLAAYRWLGDDGKTLKPADVEAGDPLSLECKFLLDYEDEEDDEESNGGRKKKKPYRLRWPDEVRDEVLARLLKLNAERAEQERLSGQAAAGNSKGAKESASDKPKRAGKQKSTGSPPQAELLNPPQGELFNG